MVLGRPLRYRCDLPAELVVSDEAPSTGRIIDLSETGAFLETRADLQFGDQVVLRAVLPDGEPWEVTVRVSRLGSSQREIHHPRVENVTVARLGAGVRFEKLEGPAHRRLMLLLDRLDES
jgi:hypothetical protein